MGNWSKISINLNTWVGNLLRIRFRAEMDGGVSMDTHDIAIDGVEVDYSQGVDLRLDSIDSPIAGPQLTCNSGAPVKVTVSNLGPADVGLGTPLPLSYSFTNSSGPPITVNETLMLSTPLLAGSTLSYTFSTPLSVAPTTTVALTASVTLPWDSNPSNDTLFGYQYTNAGAPLTTTFPAIETFDQINWNGSGFGTTEPPASCWINIAGENSSAIHDDWYFANGSVGVSSTGPTGDHTSGFGSYAYAKADAIAAPHTTTLISPAYDVTQLTNPTASFWIHSIRGFGVAAALHVDLLHGATNALLAADIIAPVGDLGTTDWTPIFASIDTATYGNVVRLQFRLEVPAGASLHDIAIDDLTIRSVEGQSAVIGSAEFDISGATDAFGFGVQTGIGGPFQSTLNSGAPMSLSIVGPTQAGCLLLSGPLNLGIRTYPGIGQLDLGIPPVLPSPQGVTIIVDGISGTSLLDLLFNTGPSGVLSLNLNVNIPPGNTFPLQAIVASGASGVITLTNAIVLTVQ